MATIKHYVNLPAGVTANEGAWRATSIAPNTVPNVGLADRVNWEVLPQAGNMDIQFVRPVHRSPAAAAGAKMRRTQTAVSSGRFRNRILFSQVGGEKFKIKASKKNGAAGDTAELPDTIETWRKIYYTLYYMGANQLNAFNALEADFKAAYTPAFIELESVAKIAALTVTRKSDLVSDTVFMRGAPNGIISMRPHGADRLAKKPFHLAILLVQRIYDSKEHRLGTGAIGNVVGTTTLNYRLLDDPPGTQPHVKSARVRFGATNANVRANIAATRHRPRAQITWNLGAVPGLTAWVAAGRTFRLNMTLVEEERYEGYSWRNFCAVQAASGQTSMLQTFTHEVGHAVAQAVRRERRWNAAGTGISQLQNANWYNDPFGGQGPHCSFNAALTTSNGQTTSGQMYMYAGAGNLCTMFDRDHPNVDPKGKFCPQCEPRVKRAVVDRARMIARRWNHYG